MYCSQSIRFDPVPRFEFDQRLERRQLFHPIQHLKLCGMNIGLSRVNMHMRFFFGDLSIFGIFL